MSSRLLILFQTVHTIRQLLQHCSNLSQAIHNVMKTRHRHCRRTTGRIRARLAPRLLVTYQFFIILERPSPRSERMASLHPGGGFSEEKSTRRSSVIFDFQLSLERSSQNSKKKEFLCSTISSSKRMSNSSHKLKSTRVTATQEWCLLRSTTQASKESFTLLSSN